MIPLVYLSVFMPVPSCLHFCGSIIEFDFRNGDASRSSFIAQDCLSYPGFFVCLYKVDYCSFEVCEELCWNLIGIPLNLYTAFGMIAIFITLIRPIQEHWRSFHFLVSSSVSFFKDLKFLSYRSFTSFVSVTPRYFILFVTIVNGDASLISFSAPLSFVYRRTTDLGFVFSVFVFWFCFFFSYLVSCHITEGIYQL